MAALAAYRQPAIVGHGAGVQIKLARARPRLGNPEFAIDIKRAAGLVKVAVAAITDDEIAATGLVDGAAGEVDDAVSAATDGHPIAQVDDGSNADVVGAFAPDVFGEPVFTGVVDRAGTVIEGANTEEAVI